MIDEARERRSADGVLGVRRSGEPGGNDVLRNLARESLAEQKFRKTKRKHGEALTAYMTYAEVVSRAATTYYGI